MARSDRQGYIFGLIKDHGPIKRNEVLIALPSCSENLINHYLNELVEIGLIKQEGETYAMAR